MFYLSNIALKKGRATIVLSLLIICFVLTGCFGFVEFRGIGVAPYMPDDFIYSKWVSTEPDIYFTVHDEYYCTGELTINNETIGIHIEGFEFVTKTYFLMESEVDKYASNTASSEYTNVLLRGTPKFENDDEMTVRVDYANLMFGRSIKKIKFVRDRSYNGNINSSTSSSN